MIRIKKKVPTKKITLRIKRKKPKIARCAICKKPLLGVPRKIPSEIRKLPKSKRRPSRPFGGYLCSACMRKYFIEKARVV